MTGRRNSAWLAGRPHTIPCAIGAVVVGLAVGDWPYGVYVLTRWVVCSAAVFVLVVAARSKQWWAAWVYGVVALLFNPVLPFHLNKATWQPLDITAALAMVLAIVLVRERSEVTASTAHPGLLS